MIAAFETLLGPALGRRHRQWMTTTIGVRATCSPKIRSLEE
jgi:hypothetical protein